MVLLRVYNSRTEIYQADPFILHVLDREFRFPTPTAHLIERAGPEAAEQSGWDGWMRLLRQPRGIAPWVPSGLLDRLIYFSGKFGYPVYVEDLRRRPAGDVPESARIPLRDYQKEAVERAVARGMGVLDLPPRSGKTRIACEITRQLALPTIWIAPTDRIVEQTQEVLEGFFGKNYSMHLIGSARAPEASRKRVVLTTAATAVNLPQSFYQSRKVIVVDEFHHCLHPTTRVLSQSGWKIISGIEVGDLVYTEKLRWRRVVNVWRRPAPAQMLRMRIGASALLVTDEHKIFTEKGKIRAGDLRCRDAVRMLCVREGFPEKELWGSPGQLPAGWREFCEPRISPQGNGEASGEFRLPEISIRSDARGEKPVQKIGGTGEDAQRLASHSAESLRARDWGKRESADSFRIASDVGTGSSGFSTGGADLDGQPEGQSAMVLSGLRASRSKGCCRDRREQPFHEEPARIGSQEGCFSGKKRMDCVSASSPKVGAWASLADTAIGEIERIEARCTEVFDLEVEEDHSYFAEGVLVSNSASSSYRKIFSMCDHIYHRYGMTGTYFRSSGDDLAMHALISGTIYRATSADMLRLGHLVPVRAVFLPIDAHKIPAKSASFFSHHGKSGIHEHALRNQWAAYAALALLSVGRKVLVLVGTKAQGNILREMLLRNLPPAPERAEFKAVEFVSTDRERKQQGKILRSFSAGEEVKILIGTSILGEGVDLPAVDALVYAKGEKAEVSLTQAIYRVCTAIEGKREAVLVDFADRHHRKLLEHAKERLRIYYEEPIFRVEVVRDSQAFVEWIEKLSC